MNKESEEEMPEVESAFSYFKKNFPGKKYLTILILLICGVIGYRYAAHFYYERGLEKNKAQKYQESVEDLDIAIKLTPYANHGEAYFLRGKAKFFLLDTLGALQDFNNAIIHNYTENQLYGYRSIIHAMLGNYKEAILDYDITIANSDEYASLYYERGMAKVNIQDYTGAMADFNASLKADSNFLESYAQRGNIYFEQEKFKEAEINYKKCIELDTTYFEMYCNMGIVRSIAKDYTAAIKFYDNAIALNPVFTDTYYNRAKLYYANKKYDAAIEDYTKAMELNPSLNFYLERGDVKQAIGDVKGACSDWHKAQGFIMTEADQRVGKFCK